MRFTPGAWRCASTFQSKLPVLRSMQMTRHDAPSSVVVVRKTVSPKMIGDDHPFPGICVFQWTFSAAVQLTGNCVSFEMPCPLSPRNLVQFSPCVGWENTGKVTSKQNILVGHLIVDLVMELENRGGELDASVAGFDQMWHQLPGFQ